MNWPEEDPAWLPEDSRDQSCAFCGSRAVEWVHPLDPKQVAYTEFGKGFTLPTYWTTCSECEELVKAGATNELLERMKTSGGFQTDIDEWSSAQVFEHLYQPLETFRRADLGAQRLPPPGR